jgi:hypothetical protein
MAIKTRRFIKIATAHSKNFAKKSWRAERQKFACYGCMSRRRRDGIANLARRARFYQNFMLGRSFFCRFFAAKKAATSYCYHSIPSAKITTKHYVFN